MTKPPDAARRAALRLLWPRDLTARRPPRCPPGWTVAAPDFVGVGVQKAGTSWWFRLLEAHPQITWDPRLPKELHFFDDFWRRDFGAADVERYARFFPRPPGSISGEWTPRYLSDFWVPGLLRVAAPQAKILVLLRDPVTRYQSGLTHALADGARPRPLLAEEALHRGFYGAQLTRLLAHVPAERLLVLQYERCQRDPTSQLRRTYAFLGLDDVDFVPPVLGTQFNQTTRAKSALAPTLQGELVARYETDVRALRVIVPDLDLSLWRNFAHLDGQPAGR